jgi:uncharacterized protein YbgA (DUF1722 family)/uncharacterized protein YbbK (DUF523 family)
MTGKLRLGISTCLLGEKVRYDGEDSLDHLLASTMSRHVDWVPVCPEVELGLGVPRETIRLVGDEASPRLVTSTTRVELTARMRELARSRVEALATEDLSGFVFKARSPSCGLARVKIYDDDDDAPRLAATGMFARAFLERCPSLPVAEAEQLHDVERREAFIERVFVMRRWRRLAGGSHAALVEFHARHKLLLMAHSPAHARALGRLVATGGSGKGRVSALLRESYAAQLQDALARKATRPRHVNVLHHAMGYFKRQLSSVEKQELLDLIEGFRRGELPLIVPITLLAHHARSFGEAYLASQWYLAPEPAELGLRYHA